MTSSNFDRQMAAEENEHFWRLYLFLNEGVSFLSRGIILRKLDVLGQDLSSLLRENEKQIKKNDNLDSSELDILFPVDGETKMDKWNPNMYLCVILELFQKSLETKERTKLKAVQQVLKDLCQRRDDTKINFQTYEEHVYNLEDAFLALTFNEASRMKIAEITKIYLNEPLNYDSLQDRMAKMEFLSMYNECTVVIYSRKDNNAEVGSDEIGACAINEDSENDSENSSDGIGTVVILGDVENEIVSNANKPQTDEETRCLARRLDMTQFEKYVRKEDLKTFISEELNTWKNQHLNIAVIGRTGVGKSRLINAIRGCKEGDSEYAQIDVTETTMSAEKYPDPKNPLVAYWDLPGIGTDNFPRRTYVTMKEIRFFEYDLYLIVCADRFTEDEDYLARTLEEKGKTFLFVRTKADVNEEEFKDFKSVLEKMRKNCVEKLKSRNIQAKDIYLISSKKIDHKLLEFDRLVERLVNSLSDLKKEALLNSLRFNTKTLIMEKKTQLIKRAKKISAVSAIVGAVPLPGLSFCVDYNLILNELDVYRNTLLITENNLEILAEKTGIDVNELKSKYNIKSFILFKDRAIGATQFLAPVLKKIAMSEVAESTAKLIPVIGTTIGAGISGCTTYKFLTSTLEILVQDAETMLDILLEKTGSSIFESN